MIFVNLPVADLAKATQFYSKLGFKQNREMSNDMATAIKWDDEIWFMLLTHDFYRKFIGSKTIADTKATSAALISLSLPSADSVRAFGNTAKQNGGGYYSVDMGIPEDQMFGLEVQDPDGNMLEVFWMKDNPFN